MAVQLSKSNNLDGRGEKEESQGQKNCGQFLTHAPLTKKLRNLCTKVKWTNYIQWVLN